MDQTVVGLFSTLDEAQKVVTDLTAVGIQKSQITVTNNESMGVSKNEANTGGGFWNWLLGTGVPETEAGYYAEGVRRRGTLVTASVPQNMAQPAADIMSRHNAINIDQQGEQWKQSGWTGYDANASPYTGEPLSATKHETVFADQGKTVLPVVEEQLQVGKREVERGTVHIYTRIIEQPVAEQITLRQEHVTVERHPVDRAITAEDTDFFQEKTIEMIEHAEEVVVSKSARVVEEVVIGKDISEHTDTIRDTVRRTDVKVEQTSGPKKTTNTSSTPILPFDTYADDFRKHYNTTYAKTSSGYDQYALAYRYGYDLAQDNRYSASDWNAVRKEAHAAWEEDYPRTWDQFKDAIKYAWDKARNITE